MRQGTGPVLVGYDGSEAAAEAIEQAGWLFAPRPAVVVNVWDSTAAELLALDPSARTAEAARTLDDEQRQVAERVAAEGAEIAGASGLQAEPRALRGRPQIWAVLLDEAEERNAATLVVGSRGRGAVRSALLGSVSSGVLHHSARPVLVVPPGSAKERSGPVLIAFDGSEHSRAAVEAAGALLPDREALVATVWMSHAGVASGGALGAPADVLARAAEALDREIAERAASTAEDGARLASQAGMRARSAARRGEGGGSHTALRMAAAEVDAPLLVTGSRGRGPLAAAVLGSVSSALVHYAEIPVLVGPRP